MEKSKVSKIKQGKGCTTSIPTSTVQLEPLPFATVESVPVSKKMTFKDKSNTCNPNTLKQKSSLISAPDSTLKEKDCVPYWTDYCFEISSRLLLPVGIDYADLDLSLYSIWLNKTVDKSWFSTKMFTVRKLNSQPIFSQLSTSSLVECTDLENIVKKSKKIKIFLNPQQKAIIKKWFGVSRFVYNQTIEYLKEPENKANWKAIKTGILNSLPDWCSCVPYQIKSIAIKDACQAVSKAKKDYNQTGKFNNCRFRSRKAIIQSCYIPKSAINEKGIYYTKLGHLKYGESLPENILDSRLVWAYGDYYLTIPVVLKQYKSENQGRVVALDPGIRTFQTFFSENSFGEIGNGANLKVQKLCFKLDALVSKISQAKCKQKRRLKKAANRLRCKIKSLIDELHKKTAKFLVDSFDFILLPTFETSQMSKKAKRRIRSKSVRQMLTLSHYKFKQFLKHKAFEYGKKVFDVNEAYTSKTVSWTGEILQKLGGSKVVTSKIDGRSMPRDLNGARGIFLRALVDTPSLRDCIC